MENNKVIDLANTAISIEAEVPTEELAAEPVEQKNNLMDLIMEEVARINPMFGGFEELAAMLALPDDQFELLSTYFLDELERSMNSSNERLMLINLMTANGLNTNELATAYSSMVDEIDKALADVPEKKRDFLKSMMAIVINAMNDSEGASKRIIQIPIIVEEGGIIPTYARNGDAGMDVYSTIDVDVAPGQTVLIPTGLKMAIPYGYEIQVRNKSGIALKTKLRVANTPGTIDAGYRDEIGVIIENIESPIADIEYEFNEDGQPIIKSILYGKSYHIDKGQKIAQLVLSEVPSAAFYEVNDLNEFGESRGGGFGSTGLKKEENGED